MAKRCGLWSQVVWVQILDPLLNNNSIALQLHASPL